MRGPKEESKKLSKIAWVHEIHLRPINGLTTQNQSNSQLMNDQYGPSMH